MADAFEAAADELGLALPIGVVTEWGVKYSHPDSGSWVSPGSSEAAARVSAARPHGADITVTVVARRVIYGGWQERE